MGQLKSWGRFANARGRWIQTSKTRARVQMIKQNNGSKAPDPIDLHVGRRLRARRIVLGLSQGELGSRVGVTFQQIQKYEGGSNRVSASMLWHLAKALEMPAASFYDGVEDGPVERDRDLDGHLKRIARLLGALPATQRRLATRFLESMIQTFQRETGRKSTGSSKSARASRARDYSLKSE